MDIINYIEGKYREIKPYEDIEFIELYSWVNQSKLKSIFATVHRLMVKNYSLMNERLPTNKYAAHFWAEKQSRITSCN